MIFNSANSLGGGGGGVFITPIPIISGSTSFTYDGSEKELTFTNLDNSKVQIVNATATNAGSYTAIARLKNAAKTIWSDGTTVDRTFSWSIEQATGEINIDPTSITLNTSNLSDTITFTKTGDGEVTVESSDTNVASVSLSGNTVTVSSVNNQTGNVTITFSIAATTNYTAATATASVICSFATVYGVEWDGTSTTSWTRTDSAVGFTDPVPAVSNGNGSSPFDDIMPWSGMVREEISSCGTMVKIPKFWYKWTRSGSTMKLQISNGAKDGFYTSPAHADRGDGNGQRDYVYVGAYHCVQALYKSAAGVLPQTNVTRDGFRTAIHHLGTNVWQWDYAMLWTIRMLYLVEYADWNSQAKIGYGCGNGSFVENVGSTDSMTYHTGTNASSRTSYGHTRYRYIEGLWDNVFDWCDGIYFSDSNVYCIKNPSSFSDTSSGGTLVGTRATSSNEISTWTNPTASGFEYALYPSAVVSNSNYDTYISDHCYYGSGGVVLFVGGYYNQYQLYGLFCSYGCDFASFSGSYVGSRPMLLP